MKKNIVFRAIIASLLAVVMVLTCVPGIRDTAYAAEKNGGEQGEETPHNILTQDSKKPKELDTYPENVYDVEQYEPFMLSEENELALIYTTGDKGALFSFDSFDLNLHEKDDNDCYTHGINKTNAASMKELKNGSVFNTLSFVQSIGFDPGGTGRKDHIASVGFLPSGTLELVIQDANGNMWWAYVGTEGSVSQAYSMDNWAKDNVLAITAGDYDGDGKDSIILYYCGNGDNAKLYEYYPSGDTFISREILNLSSVLKDKQYTEETAARFKPSVSLATGDFIGDGRDQLAFSAGFYNTSKDKEDGWVNYKCDNLEQFATCVGIGDCSDSGWSFEDPFWMYEVSPDYTGTGNTSTHAVSFMHAGVIAAGDVDNDGIDEIVAAGYTDLSKDESSGHYARAIFEGDSVAKVSDVCNYSKNYLVSAVISLGEDGYECSKLERFSMSTAQGYTFREYCNDSDWVFAKHCMACGKTNGNNNDEMVFIDGILYDFSNKTPTIAYSPYFLSMNLFGPGPGTVVSVNWFRNVAVGNFNGNTEGREQFVFTFWQKNKGENAYSVVIGAISSVLIKSQGTTQVTPYDKWENYACSLKAVKNTNSIAISLADEAWFAFQDNVSKDCSLLHYMTPNNKNMNAVPVAVDFDDDGVRGRFRSSGYVYTDPEVLAVLEAAPYYSEMSDVKAYNSGWYTKYNIATSYGTTTSRSDNVSFEVGFAAELEVGPVKTSLEAGYCMDWSRTYEKSYTITTGEAFYADDHDIVVMQRIPELIYTYDIWDKATGDWIKNGMSVRVPLSACYYLLSIDQYNGFVDEFNAIVGADSKYALRKIKMGLDLPIGHEGNPDKYWSDWDQAGTGAKELSVKTYESGTSSGAIEFAYSTEAAQSESSTISHGMHFGLTVQAGGDIGAAEAWAGGYVNMDYSESTGHSTTSVNIKESGGFVPSIDGTKVPGLTSSQIDAGYGFKWAFGRWTRDLCADRDPVPFYGYIVTELKHRALPPQYDDWTTIVDIGYSAFSVPNLTSGLSSDLTVTKVSGNSKISYDSSTKSIKVAAGLAKGTYSATFMISNGLTVCDTTFNYILKVGNTYATYNGGSLSLKDKISVNLYAGIPDDASGWTARIYYEKDGFKQAVNTYKLNKSSANGYLSSSNEYKFVYSDISAKEMTERVRLMVFDGNGTQVMIKGQDGNFVNCIDFSASDWANTMLADSSKPEKTHNMAKALLNFGGVAQEYFNYKTELNANAAYYLTSEMKAVTANSLKSFAGVTDANAAGAGLDASPLSLSLKSETYLNVYFNNSITATATNLNGANLTVSKSGSNWIAKFTGITAKNLGTQYTITVTGNGKTSTIKYSALSWAYTVLQKGTSTKAIPLAKALYLYQQAAVEYFKK